MTKTVFFEKKYGVNINKFATTKEIDEFVAKRNNKKKLNIVDLKSIDDQHV
jgi:hypothetical protein